MQVWTKPKSWDALIDLHVRWLSGEIPTDHPSDYAYQDLDTTDRWTSFLKTISTGLKMFTTDSQIGKCPAPSKPHPAFIKQIRTKHPDWNIDENTIAQEVERPYVGGFIPLTILDKMILLFDNKRKLTLFVCRPGPYDIQLFGGHWDDNTLFNLTKSDLGKGMVFKFTNVTEKTCKMRFPEIEFAPNNPLRTFVQDKVAYVTITTNDYCSSDNFMINVRSLIKNL